MRRFGIGQSVTRVEDPRFLRGNGRYTDDIKLAGQVHGWVARSLYPMPTSSSTRRRPAPCRGCCSS